MWVWLFIAIKEDGISRDFDKKREKEKKRKERKERKKKGMGEEIQESLGHWHK